MKYHLLAFAARIVLVAYLATAAWGLVAATVHAVSLLIRG